MSQPKVLSQKEFCDTGKQILSDLGHVINESKFIRNNPEISNGDKKERKLNAIKKLIILKEEIKKYLDDLAETKKNTKDINFIKSIDIFSNEISFMYNQLNH